MGLYSLLALSLIWSCSRDEEPATSSTPTLVDHMKDMSVSSDFEWSASKTGEILVLFSNPDNISLDQEMMFLEDSKGNVLQKVRVHGNSASFDVELPSNDDVKIHFPYTDQRFDVNGPGRYTFRLEDLGGKRSLSQNGSCTNCAQTIINNLAEEPAIPGTYGLFDESQVPGWETTAPDGLIEIWTDGFFNTPAQEGRQFFEINANSAAALYQTLCLEPGTTIRWSVFHRGRNGVDVARVKIGESVANAVTQKTISDDNNAWGHHFGTYDIPANQTTTVFVFEAVSSSSGSPSSGNLLDNFRIECDEDGDGVQDEVDDFPQDPARASRSFFPSHGRQTVVFEDLWPALGDYDFNDLALNQKVEIIRSGANELVEANFEVSIDAIGAGVRNGIGLLLRNNNNGFFNAEITDNFSGDISNDPLNTNGFILSDDVVETVNNQYRNNGIGPTATPDTLKFTLSFKPGLTVDFIPELYLFRSNERGREVHRPGIVPSAAFDASLANTLLDNGDFRTESGLPWAFEIISNNHYRTPAEEVNMVEAYPLFQAWVISSGSNSQTWFDQPITNKVIDVR